MRYSFSALCLFAGCLVGCHPTIRDSSTTWTSRNAHVWLQAKVTPGTSALQSVEVTHDAYGASQTIQASEIPPGGEYAAKIPKSGNWTEGQKISYEWVVRYDLNGPRTKSESGWAVWLVDDPRPTLVSPAVGATSVGTQAVAGIKVPFEWQPVPGATTYGLEVRRVSDRTVDFNGQLHATRTPAGTLQGQPPVEFLRNTAYEWQMVAQFWFTPPRFRPGPFSATRSFTTRN
ncbi:MAG: hypothetical protein L6R00_19120 [Phycisphaerae bacterium]|nr:hypothetical protein [Phycisphaerae bacterium]